ncbi:MAG: ABC transporter substrate-binding protein [Archangium gephyra]|uniref:ABC transporter substrate-binding protein n=1 Tax=Archangium gephyra TaxID=48 RepID=A0A2W5TH22_9BACT|nr:MAG: ABC transporter substrate-binding protein [Archangium gephyra]
MCGEKTVVDAGVPDAGPPVLTEKEPNDAAAQALVLTGSSVVEANLGADPAKPDSDWYALQSALPRTIDLQVTAPNGADVALEVVDETGGVLATINGGGVGATERLPNLDVSAKTFVRVVSLKKGIGGAYTLTAKFSDRMPGYELEPNERKVDATPVALGQAISGTVGHSGDVDWYRYELPAEEETPAPLDAVAEDAGTDGGVDGGVNPLAEKRLALRIDISSVEGVVTDVQLLTEAEAVLFQAKSKENAALSLRNVGVRAADRVIYVAVKSGNKKSNADVSYTLTVAPEDTGDNAEFEPNDELNRATDVPPNSYRDGFISPKGDVDYYRLVTDGPSIATLQVSGVDKVDLQLSVMKPVDGKPDETLLKANEGASKEPEQLNSVSCDGVCFIRVEAASKKVDGKWVKEDENGDQAYRLTATVVPDDGSVERESNNTAATATKLEFGKPVRGTVFPKKDVDYFSLDLSDRPVKTALTATLTGVLKVDVGLYLHRIGEDGKLTLVQTSDGAKGDRPEVVRFAAEPGQYVFEVRDAKNREANFQDSYQLTVEEGD